MRGGGGEVGVGWGLFLQVPIIFSFLGGLAVLGMHFTCENQKQWQYRYRGKNFHERELCPDHGHKF